MNHLNLEEFERKIEYRFSDKNLLILALTHSSYANEIKKGKHENNERLEFLGDAVLDMVVSEYMYRHFPKMPEGELTKLRAAVVCEGSLAELSMKMRKFYVAMSVDKAWGQSTWCDLLARSTLAHPENRSIDLIILDIAVPDYSYRTGCIYVFCCYSHSYHISCSVSPLEVKDEVLRSISERLLSSMYPGSSQRRPLPPPVLSEMSLAVSA